MPILCPHATQFHERRISSMTFTSALLYGNVCMRVGMARTLAERLIFGFTKFTKMLDSLPWTLMNRRAKCDATSFIVSTETRNRTNTKKHTNKQKLIYPHLAYRHVSITNTMVQNRQLFSFLAGEFLDDYVQEFVLHDDIGTDDSRTISKQFKGQKNTAHHMLTCSHPSLM